DATRDDGARRDDARLPRLHALAFEISVDDEVHTRLVDPLERDIVDDHLPRTGDPEDQALDEEWVDGPDRLDAQKVLVVADAAVDPVGGVMARLIERHLLEASAEPVRGIGPVALIAVMDGVDQVAVLVEKAQPIAEVRKLAAERTHDVVDLEGRADVLDVSTDDEALA